MESVAVTIELPVSAPLRAYVRALEAARDAQTDEGARQALAAVTALASRGLVITVGKSIDHPSGISRPSNVRSCVVLTLCPSKLRRCGPF